MTSEAYHLPDHEPQPWKDPILDVDLEYHTPFNVEDRFRVYDYDKRPFDFESKVLKPLKLRGDETILDVGCARGGDLVYMRDRGHRGALIGVDIIHEQDLEEGAFSLSSFYPEIVAARVNFLSGKSPELPLADNSVDVLLAKFMIYHVPNPSEALADFQRVLKPGGKLVIATSGPTNKIKHRQFEQRIADFLAKEWGRPVNPPTRFAAPFDTVVAEKLLPEYFDIKSHRAHRSKLRIKDEEGVFVYLRSLLSMKDSFRPIPHGSEVERAIGHKVLPEIFEDIADPKRGHFSDSIDRHYYICENTKKTAAGSALETSE